MKNFYDYKVTIGMSDGTLSKLIKNILQERFPTVEFRVFVSGNYESFSFEVMYDTGKIAPYIGFQNDLMKTIHDKGPWKNVEKHSSNLEAIYRGDRFNVGSIGSIRVNLLEISDDDFALLINKDLFSGGE